MGHKKKKQSNPPIAKARVRSGKPIPFQEKLEQFLRRRNGLIFSVILLLGAILGILMFNVKISVGNDDAMYIEEASKWSRDFDGFFYSATAPLYVFFLAVVIKIIGVNLMALKVFSLFFYIWFLWLFHVIFRNRVPYAVYFPVLFITAINWFLLSYSSLTYTELFSMALTMVFLWGLFILVERHEKDPNYKKNAGWWAFTGFMIMVLSITRNVALVSVLVPVIYFLFRRDYKAVGASLLSFAVFKGLYEFAKTSIWGSKAILSDQFEIILRKEAYKPQAGYEDFAGFINRFIDNTVIYLSGRFWEILGFIKENQEYKPGLAVLTVLFIVAASVYLISKKEKFVFLSFLNAIVVLGATFFALQTSWGQGRLVMIHIPFILLGVFYMLYRILKGYSFIYFFIFILIAGFGLAKTKSEVKSNLKNLKKNLKGDMYAGYTDDWRNFLMMSEWCADSLPAGSYVASRKAPMSFVYGKGKEFFPIYNVPSDNADTLVSILKRKKVTHVMVPSLRLDPSYNSGQIINTIHNYFGTIEKKYPGCLFPVHHIGNSEPCDLYRIVFPK